MGAQVLIRLSKPQAVALSEPQCRPWAWGLLACQGSCIDCSRRSIRWGCQSGGPARRGGGWVRHLRNVSVFLET